MTVTEGGTQFGFGQDVGPAGDGMVVWSAPTAGGGGYSVFARRVGTAGERGERLEVSSPTPGAAFTSSYAPAVRYDASGTATVVWLESSYDSESCLAETEPQAGEPPCQVDEYLKARQIDTGGSLAPEHVLYHHHAEYPLDGQFGGGAYLTYGQPAITAGPGGTMTVVWSQSSFGSGCAAYGYSSSYADGECEAEESIRWLRLTAAASPQGQPQVAYEGHVSGYGSGQPLLNFRVGAAADGAATVLFSVREDSGGSGCWGGQSSVDYLRISTAGTLSAVQKLGSGCGSTAPDLAVDPGGTAFAVWGWEGTYSGEEAMLARINPAGQAETPQTLLDSGEWASVAGVDVARGPESATAVWSAEGAIHSRRLPLSGALGPVVDLAAPAARHDLSYPRVAVAPDGLALVSWEDGPQYGEGNAHAVRAVALAPNGSPGAPRTLLAANRWDHGMRVSAGADASFMVSWRVSVPHHNRIQAARLGPDAASGNDDFADAEELDADLPTFASGSNLSASKQPGEPAHAGNPGGASVWYSWTPSESGPATLSTCAADGLDPVLAVYTGSALGGLTAVASALAGAPIPCSDGDAAVRFDAVAGTTYRIAVDGQSGTRGSFGLRLASRADAPANDSFSAPRQVSGALDYRTGTNVDASKELGEPDHGGGSGAASVWYSWTAPRSAAASISVCGHGLEGPLLGVYTGSAVDALAPVAETGAAQAGCGPEGVAVRFDAVAGTTYRIAVDGKDGREGRFQLQFALEPENDDFDKAQVLFGPSSFLSGVNIAATKEPGEPDHAGDPGGASVWYSWTPTASGRAFLSACLNAGNEHGALLAVYTGADIEHLTEVASDAASGSSCSSEVEFDFEAGTTYRVAVDGKGGAASSFSLNLEGLPENDDFGHARDLDGGFPLNYFASNRHATKQPGEPNHAGDPGGASVWFKWTPTSSGSGFVSACLQGSKSALLGVYTATDAGGSSAESEYGEEIPKAAPEPALSDLAEVGSGAGNGPKSGCSSRVSEVPLDFVAGTTYYIAVDGKEGAEGSISLALEGLPVNDDFADAQPLTAPQWLSASNRHATKQPGEPNHAGDPGGASVWYSWTPSEGGHGTVSACGYLGSAPLLAVYTGADVAHLTEVPAGAGGGSGSGCFSPASELEFEVEPGQTYYVAVDGLAGIEGQITLELDFEASALNDDFASAQQLTGTGSYFGTNRDATKEPGEPNHAGDPGGASVWYSWTPSESGVYGISTCSLGSFDPLLAVYTGSSLASLSHVASNDDGSHGHCTDGDSEVRFEAAAGTTYRIAVDGKGGTSGRFELELIPAPANDQFAEATELSPALPEHTFGTNRFATKEPGEPNHAGDPGGASVWYSWTPSISGTVEASVCSYLAIEPLLAVYTGTTLASLSTVPGNPSSPSESCGGKAGFKFDAVAGTTYRIAVDGKAGDQGGFSLTLRGQPANDAFVAASPIEAALPSYSYGDNRLATKEPAEPNHAGDVGGASVWFEWTPTSSGSIQISTCPFGGLNTVLAVYTGSQLGALQPVAANDDGGECSTGASRVRFDAVAGTTYRIAVDGKGGSEGAFELRLRRSPPTNDNFADAIEITQEPTTVAGTTLDATAQPGEGYWGEQSVWYKLVADETGTVRLHTCSDSGTPMGIGVFTGSSLGALSSVATEAAGTSAQCDFPPGSSFFAIAPEVAFHAVAGTTYRISADRYEQISPVFERRPAGPFVLVVDPPASDLQSSPETIPNNGASLERSNVGATREAGEAEHAGDPGGASVWFKWFAQADGPVGIDTCGSVIDTLLAVEPVGGSVVASSDDSDECAPGSTASSVAFEAEEGETYLIALDGTGGETGALHLNLQFDTPDTTPPETSAYIPNAINTSQLTLSALRDEPGSSFECALDDAPFAPCETAGTDQSATIHVKGLADGRHTLAVREVDLAGNSDPTPVTGEFVVDKTPPKTSIADGPEGLTRRLGPFDFAADEPSHFECWIDGASPNYCVTPFFASEGLADGDHVLHVRAVDIAGNVDPSAVTRSFHLDRTPPLVSIDDGPTGAIETDTASFEFSANEQSTFRCSFDDRPEEDCTSPRTFAGLADRDHVFSVTATDAAGNVSATTPRTFHVESRPPQTSIEAGPPAHAGSTSAEFELSADEEVTAFECSLDGEPFDICENPARIDGLTEGHHMLAVRAIDTAGKTDPTPATRIWSVDTTSPETEITSGPDELSPEASPEFTFGSDESVDRYECSIDAGSYAPCFSPWQFFVLADGSHTISVRAVDLAGNVDPTPASQTWTVDTTPPETSIESGPSGTISTGEAAFTYSGSLAADTARFECRLDDNPFVKCPDDGTSYSSLPDGDHTFWVRAVDAVGNVDPTPAERAFMVETTPPDTHITFAPGDVSNTEATFEFFSSEDESSFECRLDGGGFSPCESPYSLTGLTGGKHRFDVRAVDRGGLDDPSPDTWIWTVDTVPPDTAIDSGPSGVSTSTTARFGFSGSPPDDAAGFECSLDDAPFEPCSPGEPYNHLSHTEHTFRVRAIDLVGNIDPSPASRSWSVDPSGDTTAPDTQITEAPPAVIGSQSASFQFSASEDDSTFRCSVDGSPAEECTSPHLVTNLDGGPHTFSVASVDPAANADPTPAEASFEVDLTTPVAEMQVTVDSGVAPLSTVFSVAGSDSRDDPLHFVLEYGDGGGIADDLPSADLDHVYKHPGIYLASLTVTDGRHSDTTFQEVAVGLPEPLQADAGDDQTIVVGHPVHLDAGNSRPQIGITGYHWDLGDGAVADSKTVEHVYAAPGFYEVELEAKAGAEAATDTAKIHVLPDTAPHLDVNVSGSGSPLANAAVTVIDADGRRYSATTDSGGHAVIHGLTDGSYAVYASRPGYIDTSAQATVAGGTGSVAISLDPGEVAAAVLKSERLNLEQIEALGIDPNDPQNQNVYEFLITLTFAHTNSQFRGYARGGGAGGGGGGGGGFGMETFRHGSWEPCEDPCYSDGWWVEPVWDEGPMLEALKIPGKATFLKEFFSIEMLVQNLAGPGVSLTHGKASLQLPAGLSLAPTASPQTLTQPMPDIPSGQSATARWTIRGDEEGEYTPTAFYSGLVEPTGHPVSIQATLPEPLKVWGGSALKMLVQPENRVERYRPYRVKIGLKNVSDVPVYNPAVELFRKGKLNYIYQPRERLQQGAPVVEPGQTFWTDDYVLVPAITGKLQPDLSFVKKTGGNVDLDDEIQPVAQKPVAGAKLHPLKDSMVLEFQPVDGAQSYEIYRTSPELDEEFPDTPLPAKWRGPTKAVVPADSDEGAGLYAISAVKPGGVHTMYHKALVGSSLDYWPTPVTHLDYETDCTSPVSDLTFRFEDPDFDLAKYHIEIEGHPTLEGQIPPSRAVSEHISGLIDGTKVVAWATNSEQEAEGKGEHGPVLEREINGCRYVALGDSFSSGEGNPPFEDGTDVGGEDTCHRSPYAYPRLLAQGLPDSWAEMTFRACSGAKIEDLMSKNQGDHGGFHLDGEPEGPQVKYLDDGVQLVTLSIGGNNAHFKEILTECIVDGAVSALGDAGLSRLTSVSVGLFAREFIPACKPIWAGRVDSAVKELEQKLPGVYTTLKNEIDKNGKVIVLPYPQLFPGGRSECWGMTPSDVAWLHDVVDRANAVIRRAAWEGHATFADLGDRFAGHDVCGLNRWFNGPMVYFRGGKLHDEYSFHPNREGQEAFADAASEALNAHPPGSATHIDPGETVTNSVQMDQDIASGIFSTSWEGSTVETTLVAPSGRRIPADTTDADVSVAAGANYDVFTVEDPEPGTWKIENFGSDLPGGGETLRFESHQIPTENEAPEALFTTSDGHGPPPSLTVAFDGSQSFDPDGEVVSYSWDFGDGSASSGPEPTHTYGPGTFHPLLTVTDNEGKTSSYEGETIAVAEPPVLAADQLKTFVDETLELDAPGLLANDGDSGGAQLTVAGSEEAQHGTVAVHADGSLAYTPAQGFVGTDEFQYVATDGNGLLSNPATVAIRVKAVPETAIGSGPSGLIASSGASFTYSAAPGVEGAHFECRLDQAAFVSCPESGESFDHVSDGPHTFAVRVVDGEGEVDATPATRSFTVDTLAPETTIDSGPSGSTTDPTPSFGFSSSELGSSFQCRLDAGPAMPCTSPRVLTSLIDGPHSFEVGATDAAGNADPTPALRGFTITKAGSPTPEATPPGPPAASPPTAHLKCKKGFKKKKVRGKTKCAKAKGHKKRHRHR